MLFFQINGHHCPLGRHTHAPWIPGALSLCAVPRTEPSRAAWDRTLPPPPRPFVKLSSAQVGATDKPPYISGGCDCCLTDIPHKSSLDPTSVRASCQSCQSLADQTGEKLTKDLTTHLCGYLVISRYVGGGFASRSMVSVLLVSTR